MENNERLIKENNELISDIIERNYYNEFLKEDSKKNIELIINRCNINSKCYGCFNNTEKEMYPHIDFTKNDYDKIYNNFFAFLKYYSKNKWKCPIEINGLDWIENDIYEKILLLFNNLTENDSYNFPSKIIINTDFKNFLNNNVKLIKTVELFKQKNIQLFFNIYANGPYCDDNDFNEEYYNKLTDYLISCKNFKIISYIRPSNIKNWIKNYNWWIEKIEDLAFTNIELREEKTENWNYELISEYILFLKHQIEVLINKYGQEDFIKIAFNKNTAIKFHNISVLENKYLINENKNNDCAFFKNLTIDLTTMNIVPCAKVNYEDFSCGQYMIENDNITGIKAKNIPIVIYNTHLKQACMPHCEVCKHLEFCAGHCLGESYNKCYDMLVPIKEFCDLSKSKINFLIYTYDELNFLTEEILEKLQCNKLYIESIFRLRDQLKEAL